MNITVKDLVASLKKLPQNLPLVASDDEGNNYYPVTFNPSKGKYIETGVGCGEFMDEDALQSDEFINEDFKDGEEVVCIN